MFTFELLKISVYIFVAILFCLGTKAQQLRFTYIGDKLGLTAHECYNVMQDSKGYMWISTEAGLCRYNGTSSLLFDKKNGLPENSCYAVKEDKYGRVWMLTSANRVLYFEDSLKEAAFSKAYTASFKNDPLEQNYFLAFKDDSLIISTQNYSYITDRNSSTAKKFNVDTIVGYYIVKNGNELLDIKSRGNSNTIKRTVKAENKITLAIHESNSEKYYSIPYTDYQWRVLTSVNGKNENFIAIGKLLIKFNDKLELSIYELPYWIISLYSDGDNGLWVGTLKGGLYYYADTKKMEKSQRNLEGFSVSGVCVDKEAGVWCTTLEKGVFYSANKHVISYSNINGLNRKAEMLKKAGNKVYASTQIKEIIELNGSIKIYSLNVKENFAANDIILNGDEFIVAGKGFMVYATRNFEKLTALKSTERDIGAKQLIKGHDGRMFGLTFGNLLEITGNKVELKVKTLPSAGNCMAYVGGNSILVGCKDGLFKFSTDDFSYKKIKGIDGYVSKIFYTKAGKIYVVTKQLGLYEYKNNGLANVSEQLNLPAERLNDLTEDMLGNLWLASNIGLIKIGGGTELYTTKNGLPSNEIYSVESDSNKIYISTIEGISSIPLRTELKNAIPPQIYVNSIQVKDVVQEEKKLLVLSYSENSIKIVIDALTYKETGVTTVFYILEDKDSKLKKEVKLKSAEIALDNLSPGNYVLSMFAVNADGVRSVQPAILCFEILRPFWLSWWFIVLCCLFIGLIIFVSIKRIVAKVKRKEEEKTSVNKLIAESQLAALQAQMNPHFIFNAINSVQSYILKKKEKEAYSYLAKFSKLIRIVLNNSQEKTLSLRSELETIELYVELEKMRFTNSFDFELDVSENVDIENIQVPTMLIQPYVENAIWHGLMNLEDERKGLLKIDVSINDAFLKVAIEDNGIGRKQAEAYKTNIKHKPLAMKLTEQRLLIINEMLHYKGTKVTVSDLHDRVGQASGTKVELYLPIEHE